MLKGNFILDSEVLQRWYLLVVAAASDGYRIAMSCSERFNHNDQAEFLYKKENPRLPPGRTGRVFSIQKGDNEFSVVT